MRNLSAKLFTASNLKAIAVFLLSLGLAAGVLLSNLCFQEDLQTAGTYGSAFIRGYPSAYVDRLGLFLYLVRVRLTVVIALIVVGSRAWGAVVALVYCVWLGYSGGTLMAAAVMQGGIAELLYTLAMTMPQALVYLPALCLLYYAVIRRGDRFSSDAMGRRRYRRLSAAVVVLYLIGILLEAFVNPLLLAKMASI